MYTIENLKADVITEAAALKSNATKAELAKLNFKKLFYTSASACIYGQMTGSCFSDRATELILACTKRFFTRDVLELACTREDKLMAEKVISYANGTMVDDFASDRQELHPKHYSTIEAYICIHGAKTENLINFLKGKSTSLEL